MKPYLFPACLLLAGALNLPAPRPADSPCDPQRVAAAFTDTSTGQKSRAYVPRVARRSQALVAIYPLGPTWSGFLILATCDGRPLDTLFTGGVDTVVFRNVTGRRRPEALIYAIPATGSGARTSVLSVVAVVNDSLHVMWTRPYWEYSYGPLDGIEDTAEVTFPRLGHLLYRGSSSVFRFDSLADSMVSAGPPCTFADLWVWLPKPDTFAPGSPIQTRDRCKAA